MQDKDEKRRHAQAAWSRLITAQNAVEQAIMATPTGELRNELTDVNIKLLELCDKTKEVYMKI